VLDALLVDLAAAPFATALKASRYAYPVVNAVHIMALGTLFGAILALDLRLLGLGRLSPVRPLATYLPRVAAGGLAVAVPSGFLLFSVDPLAYAANPAFVTKVCLVAAGAVHAGAVHASPDWRRLLGVGGGEGDIGRGLRVSAALSLTIWTAAILSGRLIAFA